MLFKRGFTLYIMFAIILMTSLFFIPTSSVLLTYNLVENEYIHPVESFGDANQIVLDYNINLLSYSDYAYALYQNEVYSTSFMLDHNLYLNTYSVLMGEAGQRVQRMNIFPNSMA